MMRYQISAVLPVLLGVGFLAVGLEPLGDDDDLHAGLLLGGTSEEHAAAVGLPGRA